MPAALDADNYKATGIKWIASNPENVVHGKRRASATIILNDYETGFPLACLEGSEISAFRTACSAVIGAEAIAAEKREYRRIGFVGSGPISRNILNCFFKRDWQFENIYIHDIDSQRQQRFANDFSCHSVIAEDDIDSLIKKSDMIVLATSALETLHSIDPRWEQSQKIILNISLRDVDPRVILENENIVDDIDHVLREKTSPHMAYEISQSRSFISSTVGELLISPSKKPAMTKHAIFSPMGLGILDIAIANYIYALSLDNSDTISIDNFME